METGIRSDRLYQGVFRLYSEPDRRKVTVRDIVKAGGVPSTAIYHWYGDIDTLYRLAVTKRIAALAAQLKAAPAPATTARAAILEHAQTCAELLGSEDYRRLLYLVVRDGAVHRWLPRRHQAEILDAMQTGLSRAIAKAGLARGARLEIRASAARAFVGRLHGELALPMLVPGQKEKTQKEIRLLVESVAAETLNAVYSAGAVVHAIERIRVPTGERPTRRPVHAGAAPGEMRAAAGA